MAKKVGVQAACSALKLPRTTYYRHLRPRRRTAERGPVKWSYFYLYVVLDLDSRLIVGWTLARRESATLAQPLIVETVEKQGVGRD